MQDLTKITTPEEMLHAALAACNEIIDEAQKEIDQLLTEPFAPRDAENLWLGRRIGAEMVKQKLSDMLEDF